MFVSVAYASNGSVVFVDGVTQNSVDGPVYDKTTGTLYVARNVIAGGSLANPPSNALGAGHSVQDGQGQFAAGTACTTRMPWAIAMGYLTSATGAGAVAIGEETTASGANTVAIGFIAKAIGTYSVAIGLEPQALGPLSIAFGEAVTRKYGEISHASAANSWNAEGWHAIDEYSRSINGARVNLVLGDGSELDFPPQQLFSVRVRLMGISSDHTKYAHEVWEFLMLVNPSGVASITQVPTKIAGASSAGTNGFSDCAWTIGVTTPSNDPKATPSTLRIYAQPAPGETVQFSSRTEWTVLAY